MAIALWIIQGLLGLIFAITGSFKFFQSREKIIASGGTWAADFNPATVKVIAAVELISGIAVIVPRLLGHGPRVTFIAAACITLIMLGAIYTHIRRGELKHAAINAMFLLMSLFVAYATMPF